MKEKLKYVAVAVVIAIISIIIINVADFNREETIKGNITVWVDENDFDYFSKCAKDFMEDNNKASISIVNVSNERYKGEIESSIINNAMPDIAMIDSSYLRYIVDKYDDKLNVIQNTYIAEDLLNNYAANRINEVTFNGQIYAVPFTSKPIVMYLREDMLNVCGYTHESINTWNDLINAGKDIYTKTNGKVKIINAVGKDYEDLVSLLIMQAMESEEDINKVKEIVDKKIEELDSNNILNRDEEGQFLCRISSINGMKELSTLTDSCLWTANNAPSELQGSNRFYREEGKNLMILKSNEKNKVLQEKFIKYVSNNNKSNLEFVQSGNGFLSYSSIYKSKQIENSINNFLGKNPLVVMSNIESKTPSVKDFKSYLNIKDAYLVNN